jgi:hypothetical protein
MNGTGFRSDHSTLEGVQARFERWRRERRRQGPIPGELWEAAAALTSEHTYLEVSKALRVNYNDLKRRSEILQGQRCTAEAAEPAFVEVDLRAEGSSGEGEFVLEWEGLCGGKLRIRVRGKSEVDVASVVGALGALGR